MKKKALLLTVLAIFLIFMPIITLAEEDWQTRQIPVDIESGVICILDNCMMNLAACETPASEKLRQVMREKLYKDGMNKEQVYSYLAQTYGEKVLAAPQKKGFNWVAWLTPFVVIIFGGALVYLGLEKWVLPSRAQGDVDSDNPEIDPTIQEKIDKDLQKYI